MRGWLRSIRDALRPTLRPRETVPLRPVSMQRHPACGHARLVQIPPACEVLAYDDRGMRWICPLEQHHGGAHQLPPDVTIFDACPHCGRLTPSSVGRIGYLNDVERSPQGASGPTS